MSILFKILSIAYIAGIFLFANSPVVSEIGAFNIFSLLHIPLYGFLTLFLILSFSPKSKKYVDPTDPTDSTDRLRYAIPGAIAFLVAVADEIHQAYTPTRNGSLLDVFLDIIGIILCIVLFSRVSTRSRFVDVIPFIKRNTRKNVTL